MLPAAHRVTDAASFREATRRGRRAAGTLLVVHLAAAGRAPAPPRVGFVVGKAVGNSVTRNRVQRRLRHVVRPRLNRLPSGSLLVVRPLPGAVGHSSRDLAADLDACLGRLGVPASASGPSVASVTSGVSA
ncbi:ribonuclease P protein component [Nocardioides plantarum]|uniref:Ribonuclease P protein component n=1 Tax=Nocardioides plantarum TaxID=29299 RepID=A0ABV5KF90_9ACTN|nr:ribonuclease P protein component [Nocardioides plantarum]